MTPKHLLEPGRLAGSALLRAQSDERLVDLTRAGNDRAFEAIVARYREPLERYCTRLLPDGRGEDAVQQAFMDAYGALHRGHEPAFFRGWLFAIAHNAAIRALRRQGGPHEPLDAAQLSAEPAHQVAERGARLREVLGAVASLPPGQRDAILLREIEGRGHEEIARELGVTGGAARQLIRRAREGVRSAAAVVVPLPLLARLTEGSASPPTAARLAELTAVAGGGVTLAKVAATAAVTGVIAGGAVKGPDIVGPEREARERTGVAEAATPPEPAGPASPAAAPESADGSSRPGSRRGRRQAEQKDSSGPGPGDRRARERSGSSGPGSGGDGEREDERDEDEPDEDEDERDEDRSGPGGGGDLSDDVPDAVDEAEQEDSSGPGSGDEIEFDGDRSGPGSGDDEPDAVDFDDDSEDDDNSGKG